MAIKMHFLQNRNLNMRSLEASFVPFKVDIPCDNLCHSPYILSGHVRGVLRVRRLRPGDR